MKIYDISQEVFSCKVYPGDPAPQKQQLSSMEQGQLYNLTAFSMCAHNGTHVDAPSHFLENGTTVDALPLTYTVGPAFVAEADGEITAETASEILSLANKKAAEAAKRILIKGDAVVSEAAAEVFAKAGIFLLGNESQTVGPEDAPMAVHKILLSHNVILLEGIRLREVPEGVYLLSAAPLCLGGADGAPCRAVLIQF